MKHEVINRLATVWCKTFFTEPVVLLLFVLCAFVAFFNNCKERERIYFLIYFLVGTGLFVSSELIIILKALTGRNYAIFYETSNSIFELAEFIAFYFFFNKCLCYEISKNVLKIFLILLSSLFVAFFARLVFPGYSTESLKNDSISINVIEFFFLSVMCLAYFYELLTLVPKISLLKRPSFLIVTSTFFYTVLMIPFFMLSRDVLKLEAPIFYTLFSAHYILLSIVLIAFLKAFLRKEPITK